MGILSAAYSGAVSRSKIKISVLTGISIDCASRDGYVASHSVVSATDACSEFLATCRYGAAVDIDVHRSAVLAAANTCAVMIRQGSHFAAIDIDSAACAVLCASDCCGILGAISIDDASVDVDGATVMPTFHATYSTSGSDGLDLSAVNIDGAGIGILISTYAGIECIIAVANKIARIL